MWFDKACQAADYIKMKITEKYKDYKAPKVCIVLGSALGSFADRIESPLIIPYRDIEGFSVSTVSGHAGRLIYGFVKENPILCMQGRTHIYEGNSPQQVVLPLRACTLLGAKNVVLTNAAGAINYDYNVGEFMVIEDHLSFFLDSPLFGKNEDDLGLRFPSMDEAYDKELREIAIECAKELGISVHSGVYAYMKGPQFETPAEIRALRILGADAVGMSTVPETIACVHAGAKVLGISCLSNLAAGMSEKKLSHEDVNRMEDIVAKGFGDWMEALICRL
jgi:purine-nucleoside phosphorylase